MGISVFCETLYIRRSPTRLPSMVINQHPPTPRTLNFGNAKFSKEHITTSPGRCISTRNIDPSRDRVTKERIIICASNGIRKAFNVEAAPLRLNGDLYHLAKFGRSVGVNSNAGIIDYYYDSELLDLTMVVIFAKPACSAGMSRPRGAMHRLWLQLKKLSLPAVTVSTRDVEYPSTLKLTDFVNHVVSSSSSAGSLYLNYYYAKKSRT
ncbi:hypothetical protein EVAR_63275_1 [Eumeta japonica]|uniref:Uncharacterized protein n=1 Tax=Eumeta variegata TaxID=151549 RepID=A0A4C1Z1Q2_EUMVA|nr:hypothetical protein EVAR_63275_1 [Eumeta japonica]